MEKKQVIMLSNGGKNAANHLYDVRCVFNVNFLLRSPKQDKVTESRFAITCNFISKLLLIIVSQLKGDGLM